MDGVKLKSESNFIFIPKEVEIYGDIARISKVCNIYFEKLKDLGDSVYIIEQDVQATCEGDYKEHFKEGQRGHSPFPFLKKFKEGFEDNLSTPLLIDRLLINGSMVWEIPTYLYSTKDDKVYMDGKKETIMDFDLVDEDNQPKFDEMDKRFKLIQKAIVVQKFLLNEGVLSFEKGGFTLFSLDLKQYPHIFKCFAKY